MPVSADTLVVVLIVGGALFFIGRRAWRTLQSARAKGGGACDAGCGCAPAAKPRPRDWASS